LLFFFFFFFLVEIHWFTLPLLPPSTIPQQKQLHSKQKEHWLQWSSCNEMQCQEDKVILEGFLHSLSAASNESGIRSLRNGKGNFGLSPAPSSYSPASTSLCSSFLQKENNHKTLRDLM